MSLWVFWVVARMLLCSCQSVTMPFNILFWLVAKVLLCSCWGASVGPKHLNYIFRIQITFLSNTQSTHNMCLTQTKIQQNTQATTFTVRQFKSIYIDKGVRVAKLGKQELFAFTWGQVPTNCGTPISHLLFFSCLSKNKHHMMSVFILLSCTLWLVIVWNIALKILILVGWLLERILLLKMIFSRNAQIHAHKIHTHKHTRTHTHTHTHTQKRRTWVTPKAV